MWGTAFATQWRVMAAEPEPGFAGIIAESHNYFRYGQNITNSATGMSSCHRSCTPNTEIESCMILNYLGSTP